MKTLKEIRDAWESGCKVLCALPHVSTDGFMTVNVIISRRDMLRLHRYMKLGEEWDVSVDVDWTLSLDTVLARLSGNFSDLMPKEIR
jgi:hypothetical protein